MMPATGLTTPAPVELHRAAEGYPATPVADTVIMEVTSHALRMRRVEGLAVRRRAARRDPVPANTRSFHRSYEDYVEAKRIFLDYLSPGAILAYDADNPAARDLAASYERGRSVGFSLEERDAVDLTFTSITLDASGARFAIDGPLAGGRRELHSTLLGRGHLRNVALALTYTLAHGVDPALVADVSAPCSLFPAGWSATPLTGEQSWTIPQRTRKASRPHSRSQRSFPTTAWSSRRTRQPWRGYQSTERRGASRTCGRSRR